MNLFMKGYNSVQLPVTLSISRTQMPPQHLVLKHPDFMSLLW
jgi:hypothetical protein